MNSLNVAICERNYSDMSHMVHMAKRIDSNVSVITFSQESALVTAFVPGLFDLVFLDITANDMPRTTLEKAPGIAAAASVRRVDAIVPIVFTATCSDYAMDGYRLNVNQYLLKPIDASDVKRAFDTAKAAREQRQSLIVRSNRTDVSICPDRLVYVEQKGHYFLLNMVDGQVVRARGRLDELEQLLADNQFFRCHQSFLVNLAFVQNIEPDSMSVQLLNDCTAFIRRGWIKRTRTAWEYWGIDLAEKKQGAAEDRLLLGASNSISSNA